MNSKALRNHKQIINQFILFKLTHILIGIVIWGYYYILLFRETGSLQVILTDSLIYGVSLTVGFITMSFYIDKLGYLNAFRVSSLLHALSLFLVYLFLPELGSLYLVFAIVRGFSHGLFWPIDHAIKLKEIHGPARGKMFSIVESIALLMRMVVPVLAGALITLSDGYELSFLLGTGIALSSIFIPFTHNKKTRSQITSSEIVRILNRKYFNSFAFLTILHASTEILLSVSFTLIPFILLGKEFDVGALTSVVGFVAVLAAWFDSNFSFKSRLRLGYLGYTVYVILTMILSLAWSIPILVIRSLGISFTQSVGTPVKLEIDYKIRDKILGDFEDESALEFNLITEILTLIGRVVALGSVIVVIGYLNHTGITSVESLLRILIFVFAPFTLIHFLAIDILNRKIKVH